MLGSFFRGGGILAGPAISERINPVPIEPSTSNTTENCLRGSSTSCTVQSNAPLPQRTERRLPMIGNDGSCGGCDGVGWCCELALAVGAVAVGVVASPAESLSLSLSVSLPHG